MATKFAVGRRPRPVLRRRRATRQQWIDQGFLAPLDDYIAKSGFDTSQFFPGYASIFKGTDGKTYGLPKDGNTIAMAYNTRPRPDAARRRMDELVTLAKALKGKDGLKAPMCLNPGLDRGLAFLYAQGGSLLTDDGTTAAIDTDASKAAVQWYMDLFKNGLGMTAADIGDGWCGEALGKKHAAITFEGGWLDPAMTSTYPDVKYAWAEMPTGSSGSPVTISYTVSYSIGADSENKDQALGPAVLPGRQGRHDQVDRRAASPSRRARTSRRRRARTSWPRAAPTPSPGSGFMPGYNDVQKAFQDAFIDQVQKQDLRRRPGRRRRPRRPSTRHSRQ